MHTWQVEGYVMPYQSHKYRIVRRTTGVLVDVRQCMARSDPHT